MSDIRQSAKYGRYMEKIGWRTAEYKVESRKYKAYVRKIPFLSFSIIKVQRPEQINFDQLDQLAKSQRAFLVSVEPQTEELAPQLLQHGFRRNNGAMIPSKTRQIDLSPSEQAIFQTFNRTRKYKIGKAQRNIQNNFFKILIDCALEPRRGACRARNETSAASPREVLYRMRAQAPSISGSLHLSNFINLWSQNALKRGFWVPIKDQIRALYETFRKDACLILGYEEQKLVAGILMIIDRKTAHYFYAASSVTGRRLCAPSLLTWEAMKLAKKKGCAVFDFEGIYDERFPQKSWQGFSYFKESFGGEVVSYPGRFIKTYGFLSRLLFL